ncbi:MAG: single-stranded-DNA-specific exonuclease RecJ [Phycisphaeraceae bacterium]
MPVARTPQPATRWDAKPNSAEDAKPADPLLPGLHPLVDRLLRARGVQDADAAERFLRPRLTHLFDPATLPGCVRAAERLKRAVDDNQPIIIYGDYDVDGVTASAILYHTLRQAGATVSTYVPHRLDEGYGLNAQAIKRLCETGETKPLIVSVDCGITANEPAKIARDHGVDLIITDHHEFETDRLPDAYALVHPGLDMFDVRCAMSDAPPPRTSDIQHRTYPNRDLCGAGVAYKLAWQFALTYCGCEQGGKLPDAYRQLLLDLLAFAALGTVADVMPLVGENRAITTFGLQRISHTRFEGLDALIDASNLRSEKIDSYHIGFVLGPRLNACGRMGHAKEAVELLTTAAGDRARELAEQLHHANEDRKATERDILEQASEMVLANGYDGEETRAIVLGHEDWHPGVVGIVASRLVERFCRPVVLLCIDPATGEAKGSARSVDTVNLHEAIGACAAHLTKFGGHAMAAGLSLPSVSLNAFRDALVEQVNAALDINDMVQRVRIDASIALDDCDVCVFELLQSLAPFGRGNPKPRLVAERLTLDRPAQRMGARGKHLSLYLKRGGRSIRAVAWGMGDRAEQLPAGAVVDVVFQPAINDWRGNRSAELHVIDLRPAG